MQAQDLPLRDGSMSVLNRNVPILAPIEISASGAGVGRSGGDRTRTVAEPNPRAAHCHGGLENGIHPTRFDSECQIQGESSPNHPSE